MSIAETVIHAGGCWPNRARRPSAGRASASPAAGSSPVADGFVDPPPGATLIDLKDSFVLPGLIDCHVHLTGQLGAGRSDCASSRTPIPKVGLDGAHRARLTLEAGFTTVRDLGAQQAGDHLSRCARRWPRARSPARASSASARSCRRPAATARPTAFGRTSAPACSPASGVCDGVDDCRRAVRLQVAQGADAIKFAATGGVLSNIRAGVDQQFTTDELSTIIETAHMLGRRVSAHAHGTAGINAALAAGVDSIEHGSFLDEESIGLFLEAGAFHTPTIIAGMTVLGMAQGGGC